jgi:hypothetical protein
MIRPMLAAFAASLLVASVAIASEDAIEAPPGEPTELDDHATMAGEEADPAIVEGDRGPQAECDQGISMSPDELVASLDVNPC